MASTDDSERATLLAQSSTPAMRTLSTADPRSPSPVTTRLLSYSDMRTVHSHSSTPPPPSPSPSSAAKCRKPLLLLALVAAYGAGLLVWWIGGPASALGRFRPLVDGANRLAASLPRSAVADPRVLDPALVDPQSIRVPRLRCIGWRSTAGCEPNGTYVEGGDRGCDVPITGGQAGYCLMEDLDSGEQVRWMQLHCSSVRVDVRFRCRQAEDMSRTPALLQTAAAQAKWDLAVAKQNATLLRRGSTGEQEEREPSRGIVMVVYPKLLVSVHAVVRLLRESLNCSLPVELWYLPSEFGRAGIDVMATRPLLASLTRDFGPVTVREVEDAYARGFNAKVYAVLHSAFDQALFLDADNVPVRDPSFLFEHSAGFRATGAVFWPDFWLPSHSIFNVQAQSLLWQAVGTPFVDMFEQESGQLLVDRRRASASGALAALEALAFRRPNLVSYLKLAYGDKDLFRLAWLSAGAPFHMAPHPPAAAGSKLTMPGASAPVFCGMTMVQFDPDASASAGAEAVLFMHRNAKKLTGLELDRLDAAWTHVQVFTFPESLAAPNATDAQRYEHLKSHYRIQIGGMADVYRRVRSARCYGDRDLKSPHFELTAVEDVPTLRGLELELLRLGREASAIGVQPIDPQAASSSSSSR